MLTALSSRRGEFLRNAFVLSLLIAPGAFAQAPVPSFDWTMPDRFGKETLPDGRLAYHYDAAYVSPPGWLVSLDGCVSKAAVGDSITSFTWDIQGTTTNRPPSGCHFTYTFPALGTYPVKLTVATQRGHRKSLTKDVIVKDLLIVSIGDSYASSVTFVSVACSGAGIRDGLLGRQTVIVHPDAVPAASDLFAYLSGPDATARVVYRGVGDQVQELSLRPGATWQQVDLTHIAGAPPAGSNVVGYVSSDGTARVVYKGIDFHVHELYLQPAAHWVHADLTMLAGAPPAAGVPFGFAEADNTAHVVYRGTDFHIHELYLLPGAHWADADLTLLGGAPPAAGDPSAYVTTDRIPRVLYRGVLGGVHELRREGHWIDADLTNIASGAPPAAGRPFGYVTADKIARVLYRGVAGGVHELRLEGTWDRARALPGTFGRRS